MFRLNGIAIIATLALISVAHAQDAPRVLVIGGGYTQQAVEGLGIPGEEIIKVNQVSFQFSDLNVHVLNQGSEASHVARNVCSVGVGTLYPLVANYVIDSILEFRGLFPVLLSDYVGFYPVLGLRYVELSRTGNLYSMLYC